MAIPYPQEHPRRGSVHQSFSGHRLVMGEFGVTGVNSDSPLCLRQEKSWVSSDDTVLVELKQTLIPSVDVRILSDP